MIRSSLKVRSWAFIVGSSAGLVCLHNFKAEGSTENIENEQEENTGRFLQIPLSSTHGLALLGSNHFGIVDPSKPQDSVIKTPRRLDTLDGMKFQSVSLGEKHAAAVDHNGNIVQWGAGTQDNSQESQWTPHVPQMTLTGKNIVSVACDASNVYALTSKGHVISMLANVADEKRRREERLKKTWFPWLSDGLFYLEADGQVLDIQTGDNYLVALSKSGNIFFGASNPTGLKHCPDDKNLLIDPQSPSGSYKLGNIEVGSKVKQISSGNAHILALTETGRVYGWGFNGFGQLGLGDLSDTPIYQNSPLEIKSIWNVPGIVDVPKSLTHATGEFTAIIAGGDTSYFIKNSDVACDVYACGYGRYGQLGYGSLLHVAGSPVRINKLSFLSEYDEKTKSQVPLRVSSIIGGHRHAAAVLGTERSSNGHNYGSDVLAWGQNINGECFVAAKSGYVGSPTLMNAADKDGNDRFQITYGPHQKPTLGVALGKYTTAIFSKPE